MLDSLDFQISTAKAEAFDDLKFENGKTKILKEFLSRWLGTDLV
jgi:hypothetical protein